MKNLVLAILVCSHLFALYSSADQAQPCNISPGTRAAEVTIRCSKGESKVNIDSESETEIESDETYHLNFAKTLFNSKRTIHVEDSNTGTKTLRIEVSVNRSAKIKSLVEDKTWIFHGLASAKLSDLSIKTRGTLIIDDEMELETSLNIESNNLYLLKTFSIKNGTFRLKYQEGFISRLNFPFQSKAEDNFSVFETLSAVNSPSKRRINLSTIANTAYDVPLSDILDAYYAAFKTRLVDDYPLYAQKNTDDERRKYVKKYVLSRLTDNVKKGVLGETIYRRHMERENPSFQFKDPKIGLNSFDAIHIERDSDQETSPVKRVFISEVKYAANGKPVLGVIKLENREWRQLSVPYVKSKIAKMLTYNPATQAIAALLQEHSDLVELRLAVFNPDDLRLLVYAVGNMQTSQLD